jgi:hypothetical protein
MKTSSYTLIPATSYGSAVENYDGVSASFISTTQKASAYYSKSKSLQTVAWYTTGLVGILNVEATLDTDPAAGSYFPIHTIGDSITPLTENSFVNLTGKYTWIRISVTDFTAGTISKVTVGY